MYPGTIVNWHDQSLIPTSNAVAADNSPLFLTASSFDKGPEDMRVVAGQTFFDLYGSNISFKKHGQPAIQAANIINGGGTLLVKRLVAPDATLANVIFTVKVSLNTVATLTEDEDGIGLLDIVGEAKYAELRTEYENSGIPEPGAETLTSVDLSTLKYKIESDSLLTWDAVSMTGAKRASDVTTFAETLRVDDETSIEVGEGLQTITISGDRVFPVLIVTDNGRGVSNKAVRLVPDYSASKDSANFFYTVRVYEGTSVVESATASLDLYSIVGNRNYGFSTDTASQVVFYEPEGTFEALKEVISQISGIKSTDLSAYDLMYGYNNRAVAIKNLNISAESVDLNSTYGIALENGTNGSFGDAPFGTDDYNKAAAWFFYPVVEDDNDVNTTSEYDYPNSDKIFDVDEYKIAAVFDANYPDSVKEAIAKLVTFREDCVYFRDYGTEIASYNSIVSKSNSYKYRNKFIADYYTTYQIYSPTDRKRIRVTMMYDFARQMVGHFITGPFRPLAGTVNNMVLENAIEGTVNFTPRITPVVNQKSLLEDIRVNYAIFQDGQCVVQSLYTSQEAYTQLTYINNVLAIQEVIRAIRVACPKSRYTFTTQNDFSIYADAVTVVLQEFMSNFAELSFSYEQDALRGMQKIFYATIAFRFNNWAQTEVFDVYALPNED